jgi:phosphatidylglycerophosphatase A
MKNSLALALASAFYIGFIPGAPGTYASLATSLVVAGFYIFANTAAISLSIHLGLVCAISLIGVSASARVGRITGIEDPSYVVIDEVAGQLLTYVLLPINPFNLIVGLVAFRTFDIWKPYPIRKLESLGNGVGVMADDLLAGVYANLLLQLLNLIINKV